MAGTETAASLIYLDVDDEITSAAARIRAVEGERLALVLPYGSRLATSRINFRLLAREATERGKKIEIVCADPSTRALAAAAGMSVHPSVSAFERAVADGPVETPSGEPGDPDGGEITGDDGTSAPGAGVAGVPVGGLDIEDETQTRVLTLPRKSSARVPRVGPPRPPVRTGLAVGIGLAVVVLVLVGGFLALELLPSATVVLAPRSEVIGPIAFTIEAREDVTAPDPATLAIPAQRITFDLEATQTITATGTKVTETNGTGTVTFSNNDTGGSNRIPAGAIVQTEAGVQFETVAPVTLPPAFLFPFFPSTASVGVTAVEPGEIGNVAKETITVVPKGENKVLLQVTNREPTTGGAHTESPEISQADVDAALLAIDGTLAEELGRQVADGTGVPPGVDLFDQTQAVGEPEFATDPQGLVGSASLEVELVATAEGSILGVDPAPVEAIAEARLAEQVTSGWSLAPGSTAFGLAPPTVFGDIVSYPVTIQATQVRVVDQAALAEQIRGLVLAEARSRLDDYGDVEITLWPDWVTTLPKNAERITFTLGDPTTRAVAAAMTEEAGTGTILGIDLGERRIGLAVAERDGLSARPLATIARARSLAPADDARTLAEIASEQHAAELVVGLPLEASGAEGRMAESAATWARAVAELLGLPVTLRDERLSSHLAETRLGPMPRGRSGGPPSKTQRDRYREKVDREAAAIILQDELDARHATQRGAAPRWVTE